jgi:hypothetical protein
VAWPAAAQVCDVLGVERQHQHAGRGLGEHAVELRQAGGVDDEGAAAGPLQHRARAVFREIGVQGHVPVARHEGAQHADESRAAAVGEHGGQRDTAGTAGLQRRGERLRLAEQLVVGQGLALHGQRRTPAEPARRGDKPLPQRRSPHAAHPAIPNALRTTHVTNRRQLREPRTVS